MQPSPYTPGEVARTVPGRFQQLADFDERLSYLVDLHRLVGRIRIDHAPRGFGKTSLLRQYQRHADARNVLTIWVTAGEDAGLIGQIAAEISRASTRWGTEARRVIRERLEGLTVRIGVPGIVGADAAVRTGHDKTPRGSREFEDLVRAVAAGNEHQGLVILIDEIQSADPDGLRTLAYAWQHLQAEGDDLPAAVFAAGLPNASDVVASAVTFSERFAYRPLPGLEPAAEELALAIPARELGVEWHRPALEAAVVAARGYPYLVQLIGDATWTAAGRPDPGATITDEHVEAGRRAMEADMEALFRARWANATRAEREFMSAMASLGDHDVRRKDIADLMGVSIESLSVPRARLIDKGFVRASTRGSLEFTIPGFAEFARRVTRE
ncbi:ATP-binding protein [Sinomonas sp. ASV322]|uniref:ATP-binding protein n=1 Tax=Sinomonas sp. ASV322 TaxID=3041920 RepID=UPI0027DC63C8|nr:ATP-binding protein [Sinomonas sp. ASV322]MDQ4503825.1 ATP-binding protein [Sinomonas sp. ASV322]